MHWGDGHSDNFIGNPTSAGSQSHTYNDGPNDYTITVDLTDDDGTHTNAGSLAVHVNNVAPTIALSGSANVDEGSTYTLTLGAITEPGNDGDAITAYTIHWGDGKPDTTGSGSPPSTATHVYDNGPNNYTIMVDLTDDDGAHTGNGSQAVHVNEVPPTIALSDNTVGTQIGQGSTYILTLGAVTDPGTDAGDQVTTWTVHWDDG